MIRKPKTPLGLFMAERRQKLALSAREAAERGNMGYSDWLRIEVGERNPTFRTAAKIAFALDVPLAALPTDEDIARVDDAEMLQAEAARMISRLLSPELRDILRTLITLSGSPEALAAVRTVAHMLHEGPAEARTTLADFLKFAETQLIRTPQIAHSPAALAIALAAAKLTQQTETNDVVESENAKK